MPTSDPGIRAIRAFSLFSLSLLLIVALQSYFLSGVPLAGTAVQLYVSAGLYTVFFGLLYTRVGSISHDPGRQLFEELVATVAPARGLIHNIRSRLSILLTYLVAILAWPGFTFGLQSFRIAPLLPKLRGRLAAAAAGNLFLYDTSVSFYVLLFAIGLTVWASTKPPPFVFSLQFMWLLLLATLLKHVGYIVAPVTVQQRLRRSWGNPYLSFLFITCADFATYILIFNALLNWNGGAILELERLRLVAADLFAFREYTDLQLPAALDGLHLLMLTAGVAYYSTLARSLVQIKEFERNDEDFAHLAHSYAMVGIFDQAMEWLDRVQNPNKLALYVGTWLNAATGRFARAKRYAVRLLALLDIPPSDGYVATLASSGMVVYPAGRREILQTINEAQEQRVSDLILFDICKSVMVLQKVSAADLLSVFDDARKQGYPLTFCYLKWMVDEEVEIVGLLESIGTSRTGEDRLAWLGLRLLILLPLCADEGEAQRMFDEWLNTNLAEFTTLEIGDDMEKLALIGLLTQCLMMTRHLGLDRVAEIEKLAQALTVSVEINEITKGGMKMMERELASLKAAAERS